MKRFALLQLGTLLVVITLLPAFAFAQIAYEKLQFAHQPLKGGDLPAPGDTVTVSVMIKNSRELELSMRLHVSRDGYLLDLPLRGSIDSSDQIQYTTTVMAPLGELSYQFVLYNKENKPVRTSKRYVIRRKCIPDVNLTDLEVSITPETASVDPALTLLLRARGLESDLSYFQRAIDLIEESRALLVEEEQ